MVARTLRLQSLTVWLITSPGWFGSRDQEESVALPVYRALTRDLSMIVNRIRTGEHPARIAGDQTV